MIRKCAICNYINDLPDGTMPSGMQSCKRCGVEGKWHAFAGCKWFVDNTTKKVIPLEVEK